MLKALSAAATGLQAQQANVERISNDLANVNTDGYKRGRTEFEELMYETIKEPGVALGEGSITPVGVQSGTGVKVGAAHKIFEQGPAKETGHPNDLMIHGEGFFQIQMPDGTTAYTRAGNFKLDAQGTLRTVGGGMLIPQITIPNNATKFTVKPNGEVEAEYDNGTVSQLGQIQLINFNNVQGLSAAGASMFKQSQASGPPLQAIPGENGMGVVFQGALEASNVNVANSMVDMITTQRAYEMNTKVMGAVDQMLGATVNIK